MMTTCLSILMILLFTPQVVQAECGWILWWKTDVSPNKKEKTMAETLAKLEEAAKEVKLGKWKPHAAFDTRQECINSMYEAHKTFRTMSGGAYEVGPPNPILVDNKMNIGLYSPNRVDMNRLECWPSNIKPE